MDNIFDIKDANYIPKPELVTYKKVINKYKLIPDTNIRHNHTEEINKVCPISGCKTSKIKIGITIIVLKKNLK